MLYFDTFVVCVLFDSVLLPLFYYIVIMIVYDVVWFPLCVPLPNILCLHAYSGHYFMLFVCMVWFQLNASFRYVLVCMLMVLQIMYGAFNALTFMRVLMIIVVCSSISCVFMFINLHFIMMVCISYLVF